MRKKKERSEKSQRGTIPTTNPEQGGEGARRGACILLWGKVRDKRYKFSRVIKDRGVRREGTDPSRNRQAQKNNKDKNSRRQDLEGGRKNFQKSSRGGGKKRKNKDIERSNTGWRWTVSAPRKEGPTEKVKGNTTPKKREKISAQTTQQGIRKNFRKGSTVRLGRKEKVRGLLFRDAGARSVSGKGGVKSSSESASNIGPELWRR